MNQPPPLPANPSQTRRLPQMTGLSGNEIYCLHLKGMKPGNLVIGNSVYSMGLLGSIGAGVSNLVGGEVTQITQVIIVDKDTWISNDPMAFNTSD